MSEYKNVTITKEANIYFDGKVISHSIALEDGSKKSLGIMLPGEYEFGTAEKELMEIQSGEVQICLPDSQEWQTIKGGQSFTVIANSKFSIKVLSVTDYCCSYILE